MLPSEQRTALSWLTLVPPLCLMALGYVCYTISTSTGGISGQLDGLTRFLWNNRDVLTMILAGFSFLGAWAGARYITTQRRRALEYFLDQAHARLWTSKGQRNPEYRLSLFLPNAQCTTLGCFYRTDKIRSGKRWSIKLDETNSLDGIVGAVWRTGMAVQVSSPPENPTEDEWTTYRLQSFVTKAAHEGCSWPGAAILGIPIQNADDGQLIGVLIVERNRPNAKIGDVTIRDFDHEIQMCAMILQGRL